MGENRKIYAALLGAGTVGSGVYKLAGMQEEDIEPEPYISEKQNSGRPRNPDRY